MKIEDALNLYIPTDFGCDEEQCETPSIDAVFDQLDSNVQTAWGISQFVIMSDDWDKVVKIPFTGNFYYQYDENDEEMDELGFVEYRTDYCAYAMNLYEMAVDAGVDPIFAKMEWIGTTKGGKDIYTQERISDTFGSDDNYSNRKYSKDSLEKVKNNSQKGYAWRRFCAEWLAAAIDVYGYDLVERFINFCEDNDIVDLHEANYGWRKDGTPVIIDWAGFTDSI